MKTDFVNSFQALTAAVDSLGRENSKSFNNHPGSISTTKRQTSQLSIIPNTSNSGSASLQAMTYLPTKNLLSSKSSSSSSSSESLSVGMSQEDSIMYSAKKRKHSPTPSIRMKTARIAGQEAVGSLSCRFASQVRLEQSSRIPDSSDDQLMEADSPYQLTRSAVALNHHHPRHHSERGLRVVAGGTGPSSSTHSSNEHLFQTANEHITPSSGGALTPFLQNHIENLAKHANVNYQTMLDEWMKKKKELENNLNIISNCPALDSYDDVKVISNQILEIAHWLCGDNFNELRHCIPSWKYSEHSISNIMRFIRIVEDMKETIMSKYVPVNQLITDTENVGQIIRSKRLLYGDMLRQNSIAWRVLGYPIQELEPVLTQFQESIKNLVWSHLCIVHDFASSLRGGDSHIGNWDKPMGIILESILIATESIHLLGVSKLSLDFFKAASELSLIYIQTCLVLTKSLFSPVFGSSPKAGGGKKNRYPDAKVCFIYETLIQIFSNLHNASHMLNELQIQEPSASESRLSTQTSSSSIINSTPATPQHLDTDDECKYVEYFTPLYLPCIELGLELCSYASKNRVAVLDGGSQGQKKVIVNVCTRYIGSLGDLFQCLLRK